MVEVRIKVNEDNVSESAKRFGALKNEKHIRILLFIEKNPNSSMDEVHIFSKKHNLFLNRQSTHKALEKLTINRYLKKLYDERKNKIVYTL